MSYDISLVADLGGANPVSLGILDENYTSNLREFFIWFLGESLTDFNGKDASDLSDAIAKGFDKLGGRGKEECPQLEFLREFEPDNGWGSVLSAIGFLSRIYAACLKAPNSKVSIWA